MGAEWAGWDDERLAAFEASPKQRTGPSLIAGCRVYTGQIAVQVDVRRGRDRSSKPPPSQIPSPMTDVDGRFEPHHGFP